MGSVSCLERSFATMGLDAATKSMVKKIPLLTVKAGPRDKEQWVARLKEEYAALIQYVKINKEAGSDWFQVASNKAGTRWTGKCWIVHNLLKYEFDLQFDVPAMYPEVPCELELPELDGKTARCTGAERYVWTPPSSHFGQKTLHTS